MMRNWKMLGLQTLLAAALAAAPAVAEQNADDKKLEEIQKQLKEIQQSLQPIEGVIKDLKTAQGDITLLIQKMNQLQREMEDLRKLVNTPGRVSASPPTGAAGRIRLMNTFTRPMSIRVNDRTHLLQPGQTQMLENQPVGAFTYEVIGVQDPVTRVLGANEVYTIYVYPR